GLATLRNVQIDDALCGATASMYGSNSSVGTDCGTNTSASATSAFAAVASYRSSFADVTATALLTRGPNASQRASEDEIIGSTDGFKSLDGGVFLSWGNNFLTANTNDVAPGTTVGHIGLFRPLPRRR
ncbi:MAG: hypothetical protein QOJ07_1150, partial [Thermoleophilaceae bacterium]|nr:hypothetical protein [Thermoleophilaceae bacterium]